MRKLARILLLAATFGVVMSAVKGQGGGARLAFGNVSAPRLPVAFLAGSGYPRLGRAATVGLIATLMALVGFYAEQSPIVEFDGGETRPGWAMV